jgi:hypothetical protein
MTNELSANVTRTIEAVITATDDAVSLEEPLVAINWFDTRSEWLYHLYNFFASRSVKAVGGEVVIKARTDTVLSGQAGDRRDMVLLVRYPSGPRFLGMMQSKYFQFVSLMRAAAVSRFTFGFTHPTVTPLAQPDPNKNLAYMLCQFRGADISSELAELAVRHDLASLYGGALAARLATRKEGAQREDIPCVMDGAVIFQTRDKTAFKRFTEAPEYVELSQKAENFFTVTLSRLL